MTFDELYEALEKRGRRAQNWYIDYKKEDLPRADKTRGCQFLAVRSGDAWQVYYVDIRGPEMHAEFGSEAGLCQYIFEQCCAEERPNPAIMARYQLRKLKNRRKSHK